MTSRFPPNDVTGDILGEVRLFFESAVPGNSIGVDDDYFSLGLVNSLLALELVAFVERAFDVTVEVEDLDLDNFRTMNRIARFVGEKRAATEG
ncbi:MAG: acyl carrier protein [Actinomycetota bacterium]|nr:acyl carrier protein [Actinomycetota bacterium]